MRPFPIAALFVSTISCSGATGPGGSGSVELTASQTTLVTGETVQLTWAVTDDDGNPVPDARVTFTSSNPATMTVGPTGVVTGVGPGDATITASAGAASDHLAMVVAQGGVVTPAGGTVSGFGGGIELVVPAGAVATLTPVRLAIAANPLLDPTAAAGTSYEVGPASLAFATPATVRVRYHSGNAPVGLPEADLRVRRYDGTAWVGLPDGSADVAASRASASLAAGGLVSVGWAAPTAPCTGAEFREFDFWLGGWSVSSNGQTIAQSDITAVPGGCAILEHYRDNGGTVGRSISFYQPGTAMWYQTYLDNNGFRLRLAGRYQNGAMELFNPPGAGTVHERWRWTVEGANVRQVAATTSNGGASYGTPSWNGLYTKR